MRIHTGHPLPQQMVEAVGRMDQSRVTPGWLEALPSTIADIYAKWKIEIEHIVPDTYATLVALGNSNELGPVVVKSSALADEFASETTALTLAAEENVVRVFDLNVERKVMVMERIQPGIQLRDLELSDDDATRMAAETIITFWREVPDPVHLHPLRVWMKALFEWQPRPDLIEPDLILQAQSLAVDLLETSTKSSLLHGDFQHHNLLTRSIGSLMVIDPKGLYGDPGFEFAAWMYNPEGVTTRADYLDLAIRRSTIWSDICEIDSQELIHWAFVGAVLSMCWWNKESGPEDLANHFAAGALQLRKLVQ